MQRKRMMRTGAENFTWRRLRNDPKGSSWSWARGRLPANALLVGAVLALAGWGLCLEGAKAQQDEVEGPEAALSLEWVGTKLQEVQQAATLEEATKAALVELYTGTMELLRQEGEWRQKAAEFEEERLQAPDRVAAIEAELATTPEEAPIEVPKNASVTDLRQLWAQAETEAADTEKARLELEAEPGRRAERRKVLPGLISEVTQRLEEARARVQGPAPEVSSDALAEARALQGRARVQALEAEKDAYEKELRSYEARGRLLTLRQALAVREAKEAERVAEAWRATVEGARREEVEQAISEVENALAAAEEASPAVRDAVLPLVAENRDLVTRRTGPEGLADRIERAGRKLDELERQFEEVSEAFKDVQDREEMVQRSEAVGLLLRKYRRKLPDTGLNRSSVRKRNVLIGEAQYEQLELQDQRKDLADVEAAANGMLATLMPTVREEARDELLEVLRELLQAKQSSLDGLLSDYDTYVDLLLRSQLKEQDLIREADAFSDYILERVLWIRSARPLALSDTSAVFGVIVSLMRPARWWGVLKAYGTDFADYPLTYILGLVLLAIGIFAHQRCATRLAEIGETAAKPACEAYSLTLAALVATVMVSLVGPGLLWFLGWRLSQAVTETEFEWALGVALGRGALMLISLELPRQVLRKKGLAEAHFQWAADSVRGVRRPLSWLIPLVTVASVLITFLESLGDEREIESLGRVTFIGMMLAYAVFAHVLMRPGRGVVAAALNRNRASRRPGMERVSYLLAVGVPLALALGASSGYFFTALHLAWRLHGTVCFGFGLLLVRGLLLRWLLLMRRHLARKQARERREALKAGKEGEEERPEELARVDLADIDARNRSLVRSGILFALLVGLWLMWADVLPALDRFADRALWETTRQVSETTRDAEGHLSTVMREELAPVTLSHLLLAGLIGIMAVVAARNLPSLLEMTILRRLPLGPGERYAVTTLVGYIVLFTGAALVFNAIGLGWGKLQWLVAAMGVGLGFGLQEIFANFISGLIILFEQPIRVGDTVTIGGVHGTVTKIRIRATRIVDWDRKELIVPNKEFVVGQLVNWTLSDSILRVIIPVGIAYGSDTERAVRVLYEVAREHPLVLEEPKPQVLFLEFGDSSLGFELRVFCPSVDSFLDVKHDLHMAVDQAFREAGIEIAFPQQDIHVRSIRAELPITRRDEDGA